MWGNLGPIKKLFNLYKDTGVLYTPQAVSTLTPTPSHKAFHWYSGLCTQKDWKPPASYRIKGILQLCFVSFSHKPCNLKPISLGMPRDRGALPETRFNLLPPFPPLETLLEAANQGLMRGGKGRPPTPQTTQVGRGTTRSTDEGRAVGLPALQGVLAFCSFFFC